jgi:hypothetical protein
MSTPPRLHALRLTLERLAVAHFKQHHISPPPMQAFLAIPLFERLVLLAKLDGADARTIKSLLHTTDADVALESERMVNAVHLLTSAMDEPWMFIEDGDIDTQLGQIIFDYLPAILLGEAIPGQIASLSLKQRLAVYLVLVQRLSYKRSSPEVQKVLGCTEFFVRRSIIECQRAVGGLWI